ncbi:MAG: polysaccharide biosynthesis tyrosine autokinase [Planctomycetales bacterium]|nr:polysaccharide biosynthesis tyrosine autokinase [Planctomycetales bacterium]
MHVSPINPTHNSPTSVQVLHSLMRFGRIVRFRWTLVAVSLCATTVLGLLYFATVDRSYQARAQLLVQQTGPIVTSNGTTDGLTQQGMLPTYERLFTSTVVLEGALQRLMDQPREHRIDLIQIPRENWVTHLRNNMSVRSLRLTNVLEISFTSRSPQAAEAIVQALVDSYMQFMKANHETVAEELVTILRNERQSVEEQLHEKEQQLVDAKRSFGDIGLRDATQTLHPLVQRVVRINESLIEAQQSRLKLQATLASVETGLAHGADVRQHLFAVEPIVGRDVVATTLGLSDQDGATVAKLEQKLLDDETELDSLREHFGMRHPKVGQLIDSIRQTRAYLNDYQASVNRRSERLQNSDFGSMLVDMLKQEVRKAEAQERNLSDEYGRAQADAVQLQGRFEEIAMLQREVDRLLNFNHTLLNHIDSIDINQNQSDVRVEIVSRPNAGRKPVAPNALIVLFSCVGGGLCIGAGLVYIVDVLDDRFRSLDEMKLQLQTPILALIRQLEAKAETGIQALQMAVAPDAVAGEAFRTLRTTLAFSGDILDCVAVSSSEPGDGKTTIIANLGVSFAQTGRRTLLIDADLRRPGLTKLLERKGDMGLSEVLRSEGSLRDAVATSLYATEQPGLDLIPSGARPLDPTGLLSSSRFAELLEWASAHYDQVLVDSPPMLVASDAAIVGRLAGGMMLVVQPQKNHRRLVVRAIEEARAVSLNLVGLIVNRLTNEPSQAYYDDGYGYGYAYGEVDQVNDDESQLATAGEAGDLVEDEADLFADEPHVLPFPHGSESTVSVESKPMLRERDVRRAA